MDHPLKEIQKPVEQELKQFQASFLEQSKSNVSLLNIITQYIIKRKGKQVRPLFVFLSSKLHGDIKPAAYTAASLIELLHTATLVHDDVVDDAQYRRGLFSINALWKNKIAVLVGDFLLSRGLLIALENKEYKLLDIVSHAVKQMSEGELLQIEKARKLDITEAIYFEIIKNKTASLIASCCACGCAASGSDETTIENMRQFGEFAGIAFQIKDDLLDYDLRNKTGKMSGADFKEKKMTLPLIYVLNKVPSDQKKWLINTIKNHNKDQKRIEQAIAIITEFGGVNYAVNKMNEYKNNALDLLNNYPHSEAKESLIKLVNFTIDRDR